MTEGRLRRMLLDVPAPDEDAARDRAWATVHAAFDEREPVAWPARHARALIPFAVLAVLVAAAFTHRDSRAGDPDLHTHVAVANKVQTLDGRWLSIDGRVLFKANVAASETYNTALEQHLREVLGVRFAERPGTDPTKRPIREIVGVNPRLNQRWSTRRAHIETRKITRQLAWPACRRSEGAAVDADALGGHVRSALRHDEAHRVGDLFG